MFWLYPRVARKALTARPWILCSAAALMYVVPREYPMLVRWYNWYAIVASEEEAELLRIIVACVLLFSVRRFISPCWLRFGVFMTPSVLCDSEQSFWADCGGGGVVPLCDEELVWELVFRCEVWDSVFTELPDEYIIEALVEF